VLIVFRGMGWVPAEIQELAHCVIVFSFRYDTAAEKIEYGLRLRGGIDITKVILEENAQERL